ncbi:hypothetical protein, partial [Parabacteroides johnsonii]|uniref:hypothetical protein n=1 Tax=Parabacteroides johnsonii TaxID=387661 RepID=UPI003F282DE7
MNAVNISWSKFSEGTSAENNAELNWEASAPKAKAATVAKAAIAKRILIELKEKKKKKNRKIDNENESRCK